MKFLCVGCDTQMEAVQQKVPGDGTLALIYRCPRCEQRTALLTNPMETQMVSSLCVSVGGRSTEEQPLEHVRSQLRTGGADALEDAPDEDPGPSWTEEAEARLARAPGFVRGMIRRMYDDWAREREIAEMTPELMDAARDELGLEGM